MDWQREYNTNSAVRRLSRNFDTYKTIDWQHEKLNENLKYYHALKSNTSLQSSDNNTYQDTELQEVRPNTQGTFESAIILINEISNLQVIKSRIWTTLQTWLVLTIVGIIIGSIASILNLMTDFLNELKNFVHIPVLDMLWFILSSIAFGCLACLACILIAPNAAGSGISEVKSIISGFNRPDFLSFPTLFVKAFALPFTIASGLSVGKEGPSVHYASCVGNVVSRTLIPWFNESPLQLSDIITVSSGTGVAVAFGSPIGGVLFSLEEMSSKLKLGILWKTFYTSLIAITTLQWWNPFGTGQIVMFEVRYELDWNWSEIFWFILLGIFGGFYGLLISKFNIKYVHFRQKYLTTEGYKWNGLREIFWLCLITSILSYFNVFMRLEMTKVMELLFDPCTSDEHNSDNFVCGRTDGLESWMIFILSLAYATVLRMFLVVVSYGSKIPCGIFVPSMTVGATFGKFLGLLIEEISGKTGGINSGIYAFLGAGAALSGITGLTVSVVVIMYELTGAIKYIIPTMVTVISVRIVSELFGNGFGGIADQMIKFNGVPFIDLKEEHKFEETVGEVMVRSVVGIDVEGIGVGGIEKVLQFEKEEYPLWWKRETLIGVIKRGDLQKVLEREGGKEGIVHIVSWKKLDRIVTKMGESVDEYEDEGYDGFIDFEFLTLDVNTSLYTLFEIFVEIGPRIVYVVNEGMIVGLVSRKDFIRFENYQHYTEHGDVFVSEWDEEVLFQRILKVYIRFL